MNIYHSFGLLVASEIPLRGLEPLAFLGEDGSCDVAIRYGKVDPLGGNADVDLGWIAATAESCVVTVEDLGSFRVDEGARITVDVPDGADLEKIRLYLLGSCMGAVLHQRGIMPLQGSCVCKGDRAILITGNSGAGKSTLALELASRGWKLLSDDVTPVHMVDGLPYAVSTFPGQKLWQDAVDAHGAQGRVVGKLFRAGDRDKWQLDASELFQTGETRLDAAVMLRAGSSELTMSDVSGFAKVDLLMRNVYRPMLVVGKRAKTRVFQQCVTMGQSMSMFLAERPRGERSEARIADWIEERMG